MVISRAESMFERHSTEHTRQAQSQPQEIKRSTHRRAFSLISISGAETVVYNSGLHRRILPSQLIVFQLMCRLGNEAGGVDNPLRLSIFSNDSSAILRTSWSTLVGISE